MEQESPLVEFNKKTDEIARLLEKSLKRPLTKKDQKRIEQIKIEKHLDEAVMNFLEEDFERTWNFLAEKEISLSELHKKTDEMIGLREKELVEGTLSESDIKRMEEIRGQLDEETLNFIEEKAEAKWNFLEEQLEEKGKSKERETGEEEFQKIENQVNELRKKRQENKSLIAEEINLIEKEIKGTLLSEEEKQRLEEIKNKLGKSAFDFIDNECSSVWGFHQQGIEGELEIEENLQELINMSPEEMKKRIRAMEKEKSEIKKATDKMKRRNKNLEW